MIGGDISNETSPRIIVLVDVVSNSEIQESKKLLRTSTERKVSSLNNLALSHLWNVASKYGLSVELAGFASEEWTQEHLDKFMERLERRGGNPFNYAELYNDIEDFIGELPYRTNLKGIVDVPERLARYGSWGIDLNNL
ncbi:hypothetical protein UFOVP45_55 [uncultured Caudovirales phage]|uniref:Uncharacterized protein n=1 Tax=uncultured Caudovirales phage TaxID=2100421 RepID=A0A6J5KRS5_9CAUD|nr:hypothetical protein UFOVP45_55 [uncultured Caudovirales phage]